MLILVALGRLIGLQSAVIAFGLSGVLFCIVARRQRRSPSF